MGGAEPPPKRYASDPKGGLWYVPRMTEVPKTPLDKFKEAARELETDDDPQHFKERLAKVVKHKPAPDKPA